MFQEGFLHRFRKSFDRVLFGFDLVVSVGVTGICYVILGKSMAKFNIQIFVSQATSLAISLLAVIITGIAILVSLSNTEALKALKERRLYERFLFTFEFTAMLAMVVSVFGILIQSYNFGVVVHYGFIWAFLYLLLATATVISRLITYGDKMAQLVVIESLPDDLGEQLRERYDNDNSKSDECETSPK